ncbi:zinc finger protein CONSTANS-LIKE 4-like isoform X2 [Humulus lupulus]|uniref:zinc finger protein CONSTANS-LIKE 4-like isoform X2 n=1 Tax=Humulus lupulus TaxID=3486 RepID=UPI002B40CE5D|nr:zinc finger protein CONSTANS-LIKE 4-like isoform X2 [Humulus lupulus]
MMKKCELCDSPAKMYCDSDRASLCWDCDARVHSANFLVAKHSRTLLCRVCQSLTPWSGSGPKLSPTVSVCQNCVKGCYQNDTRIQPNDNEEEEGEEDDDDDDDYEDDSEEDTDEDVSNDDGGGRDEDNDEENQVVPWTNNPPPPVPSSSSSSGESSKSNGLFSSREKLSESETTFFWKV